MIKALSNRQTLMKVAVGGGLICGGAGYLTRWLIVNKFQQTDYYKLSLVNLMVHRPLVNLLGEPLSFGKPDLGNSIENYATEQEARFVVPVRGVENNGNLFFEATRNPDDTPPKWTLNNLECEVERSKTIETKRLGRVKVPIKYATMAEIPPGIYDSKKNTVDITISPPAPPPSTVSTTPKITPTAVTA